MSPRFPSQALLQRSERSWTRVLVAGTLVVFSAACGSEPTAGSDGVGGGASGGGGSGGLGSGGGDAGGEASGGGDAGGSGGVDAGSGGETGGLSGSGGGGGGLTYPEPDLLVAFIGDQGTTRNSDAVLELILDEGADATVHNGDFDYEDDPAAWETRIDAILGPDYPYFAIVGNHDAAAWEGSRGYAARIEARTERVAEMECEGELGVRANCTFRGLHLLQSCIGVRELRSGCAADSPDQLAFIADSLAQREHLWSICNWHKNQHDMQIGTKSNEVGWQAYQLCMNAGAIVATGHEHSYARTLSLSQVGDAAEGHGAHGQPEVVEIGAGTSFAFVSGLAGVGIRDFDADHDDDSWWASYAAANRWMKNGVAMDGAASYGALFIRFGVDGDPKKALAYFKDVTGRLLDEFTIIVQ